jgi:hypothetical protein
VVLATKGNRGAQRERCASGGHVYFGPPLLGSGPRRPGGPALE